MELVAKFDVILMLVGFVHTTETTNNEASPTTTSSVESSTQTMAITETTMATLEKKQETTTPLNNETLLTTTLSVEPSTQGMTMTETTMTTPGKEQEREKCYDGLIFGGIGVAVTIPITVLITLLIIWKRIGVGPLINCTRSDSHYSSVECNLFVKCAPFSRPIRTCWEFLQFSVCCRLKSIGTGRRNEEIIGSELRTVPDTNTTEQSNNADEREYDQPHWNSISLSDQKQPIGAEMENTEYENIGSCSRSSYEGLHPYENNGMNLYGSCSQEHIIQEETEEIGV
ncbi:hypothetical protein CHS0354_030652 [Potamilus streckersoni]|uniref:Uncharacterized protein n=1 Tax=Potamilus streckersoni TaxID=2493646 RepID=A0AAE0VKI8_9BIVA|nr:hypothetical protein CHS0354_030652 [Potamilus streckersoni]